MRRKAGKLEFLKHVVAHTRTGTHGPSALMTGDDYARDHVLIACEAIQLGLARLYRDSEGYGYELRITRAGRLLAAGQIEQAAAAIDSGLSLTRLAGDPPDGILGTRLHPGSQGISLLSMAARQHAPEMMRGIATGHLVVAAGVIHPAGSVIPQVSSGSWIAEAPPAAGPAFHAPAAPSARETIADLPSSRAARNIGARSP